MVIKDIWRTQKNAGIDMVFLKGSTLKATTLKATK